MLLMDEGIRIWRYESVWRTESDGRDTYKGMESATFQGPIPVNQTFLHICIPYVYYRGQPPEYRDVLMIGSVQRRSLTVEV